MAALSTYITRALVALNGTDASGNVGKVAVTTNTSGDVSIPSGTASSSPATGALTVAGGVGIQGDVFTTLSFNGKASAYQTATHALTYGNPFDKATTRGGASGEFTLYSNDPLASRLEGTIALVTDPTANNRRLSIAVIEQGAAFRNITLCETAGNVGIGKTVPTVPLDVTGDVTSSGTITGGNLFSNGYIRSNSATSPIGYTTGAGGTVTQITSRTTGVTLDKTTGAITLFAAAPAVGTWVSFTVTNSAVAATDIPHVAFKSGTNTYIGHVTTVAAGSFQVSFTSIAGTASDSPVINFAIFKGVAS